ncbi:MAG: hypothetical protein SFW07_05730 [Gammaproteobacteria bacterium]|nr:hypothetical protein [Gammaproteobacteria bacterium]
MNDEVSKGTSADLNGKELLAQFQPCKNIVFQERDRKISSIYCELASQVNYALTCERREFKLLMGTYNKKISEPLGEPSASTSLENFVDKIRYLFELTRIFERSERYCEFINECLLPFLSNAHTQILLVYGCDLQDQSTWEIANPATSVISKNLRSLDESKAKLRSLYHHVYDEMEGFTLIYQSASPETKQQFLLELIKTTQLLSWTYMWIAIAEGKEVSREDAFRHSLKVIANEQEFLTRQVH